MRYRVNRRTGDRISEIGMGSAYLPKVERKTAVRILKTAFEGGINYFDLASGDAEAFPLWGEALGDVRDKVLYQIHFGADYTRGTYGWSTELKTIQKSVAWQLKELKTDYIDYGFIHCQDEFSDWETFKKNGVLQFLRELQENGTVRHIGLSSHTPTVIHRILDEVPVDMLMFSVNPAYDYGHGEFANGSADERGAVYQRCQREGIGISVMKPFSAGQLLRADQSPFGVAMTEFQCIRYALDRPGVLTVLPGARSVREVERLLRYESATEEDCDYSVISGLTPKEDAGKCVYCNHCKPCPQGLDIGLINKYYDLARAGDPLAAEHYLTLERNAGDCISCGHCDARCPFHVHQSERMREIDAWFSKKQA
ncbi:MAG: aldo/keto reductase [Clostridia bacterium]|nr:aldo/keto reductase [Clostridia bacterium]